MKLNPEDENTCAKVNILLNKVIQDLHKTRAFFTWFSRDPKRTEAMHTANIENFSILKIYELFTYISYEMEKGDLLFHYNADLIYRNIKKVYKKYKTLDLELHVKEWLMKSEGYIKDFMVVVYDEECSCGGK